MSDKLTEARSALTAAVEELDEATAALTEPAEAADLDELEARCAAAEAEIERRKKIVDRMETVTEARASQPIMVEEDDVRIEVRKEESIYRPDGNTSFFRDVITAHSGNRDAQERLYRHSVEMRDVTAASGGAGYIPPVYLAEFAAPKARQGGPLLAQLPKAPLPDAGMTISVPRVTTGTSVAVQTENGSVSETDLVSSQLNTAVRTIAGQSDISVQFFDRSFPGADVVIADDLARAYTTEFDRQLINGVAASSEHTGLLNVSSIGSVTFTSSTPTAGDYLAPIYKAISTVTSTYFEAPTHIVMHPRRAAFLAAGTSTSTPIFQQGGLMMASGEQNAGVVGTIAGLPVVVDANVPTTLGDPGTNQDAILVINAPALRVMEGTPRFKVHESVGSATLTVRLSYYGYSAFMSGRYPEAICAITGTGLDEVL
jgi:HK97 family phage major capsid protein